METIKVNSSVKYTDPFQDEIEIIFKVLEVNGDRVIMEAQVSMHILPTLVAQVKDLTIVE